MAIPLSLEMEKLINGHLNSNSVSNPALLFTKYVRGWDFERNWAFKSEKKSEHMSNAVKIPPDKGGYQSFFNRWSSMLDAISAVQIKGKVLWRLVVGLGTGSVLETSMTLHHIFGVPYIPGSALKGVVRACYINRNYEGYTKQWDENDPKEEDKKRRYRTLDAYLENNNQEFLALFGSEGRKGKVTFLDAYSTRFPTLEMDIMNPHFQDYYSEGKAPADWLSPVPVKFVTVAKGSEFIFPFKTEDNSLRRLVEELIKEALTDSGIGAKTAVGYGYFNIETIEPKPEVHVPVAQEALPLVTKTTEQQSQINNTEEVKHPHTNQAEPPARYQKSSTELKDEFMKPDGTMKSLEEYQKCIESQGRQFKKDEKQLYEKAKKWYEKNIKH